MAFTRKNVVEAVIKMCQIPWDKLDDWEMDFITNMSDALKDIDWMPEERQWNKMLNIIRKNTDLKKK